MPSYYSVPKNVMLVNYFLLVQFLGVPGHTGPLIVTNIVLSCYSSSVHSSRVAGLAVCWSLHVFISQVTYRVDSVQSFNFC